MNSDPTPLMHPHRFNTPQDSSDHPSGADLSLAIHKSVSRSPLHGRIEIRPTSSAWPFIVRCTFSRYATHPHSYAGISGNSKPITEPRPSALKSHPFLR